MSVHTQAPAAAPPIIAPRHEKAAPRPHLMVIILDLDAADGPLSGTSEPTDVLAVVRLHGLTLGVLGVHAPIGPALPIVLRRAAVMRFGAAIAEHERRGREQGTLTWEPSTWT